MYKFLNLLGYNFSKKNFIDFFEQKKFLEINKLILLLRIIIRTSIILLLIPIIIIIRLIRPIIYIRFGQLPSVAIGANMLIYSMLLLENKKKVFKSYDFYYLTASKNINSYFLKVMKKELNINFFIEYLFHSNRFFFFNSDHEIKNTHDDLDCVFRKNNFKLKIEDTKDEFGQRTLNKLGLKKNDKFVCFLIRDKKFKAQNRFIDFSYHDYRNSNLKNFESAMKKLADMGYWVFRMGRNVEGEISFKHEKIIDYANLDIQDDFLDFWLISKCFFCVSTGTGTDNLCLINNIPIVYVNYLPIWQIALSSNTITVPKNLIWKNTGKSLTLNEHLKYSTIVNKDYISNGILIEELNPKDIKDVTLEMELRLTNKWIKKKDEDYLQSKFWNVLKNNKNNKRPFKSYYKYSRIGYNFISNNEHWFFN